MSSLMSSFWAPTFPSTSNWLHLKLIGWSTKAITACPCAAPVTPTAPNQLFKEPASKPQQYSQPLPQQQYQQQGPAEASGEVYPGPVLEPWFNGARFILFDFPFLCSLIIVGMIFLTFVTFGSDSEGSALRPLWPIFYIAIQIFRLQVVLPIVFAFAWAAHVAQAIAAVCIFYSHLHMHVHTVPHAARIAMEFQSSSDSDSKSANGAASSGSTHIAAAASLTLQRRNCFYWFCQTLAYGFPSLHTMRALTQQCEKRQQQQLKSIEVGGQQMSKVATGSNDPLAVVQVQA